MIMDPDTLQWTTGVQAAEIAIKRVLSTPTNEEIFNRSFGSTLHQHIDSNLTPELVADVGAEMMQRLSTIAGLNIESIDFARDKNSLQAKIIGKYKGEHFTTNHRIR